jgi:serine/threonine protein kinase
MSETRDPSNDTVAVIKGHLDFKERYSDLRRLGAGGGGLVFQAKDNKLDKLVAIKVLHSNFDVKALVRFQQEAKVLSMLNHRYIVGVLDFQNSKTDDLFLIMEHVDGTSLDKFVEERGPLPLDEVVKYSIQLCEALEHAHGNGVVHRDLKPSNIMIDSNKNVRILDFGIAKLLTQPNQFGTITKIGVPLGSPAFMSPEQIRGEQTDERTDVFGLGLLMYIMAAGRSPFDADQVLEYYQNLIGKTVPSLRLWIGESAAAHSLDRIVAKAMQSDPDLRFQNMAQVRSELFALIQDPVEILQVTHGAFEQPHSKLKTFGLSLLLLIMTVAIGVLIFASNSQNSTGTPGGDSSGGLSDRPKIVGGAANRSGDAPKLHSEKFGPGINVEADLSHFTFADKSVTAKDFRNFDRSITALSLAEIGVIRPELLNAISKFPLQSLDFSKTSLSDSDLKVIAKINTLTWLRLNGTAITGSGIRNLAPLGNTLKRLDLDSCKGIDDSGLAAIIETLPNLDKLYVGSSSVTPKAIPSLTKLTGLKTLWLSSLDVTDEEIKALSSGLQFELLDLSDCKKITDKTLEYLMPQRRLAYLELMACPLVTVEAADRFQNAHKRTKVVRQDSKGVDSIFDTGLYNPPADLMSGDRH